MNSLSWFIYFAGVVGSIQAVLIFLGLTLLAVLAIRCLAVAIHNSDDFIHNRGKKPYPSIKGIIPAFLFLFLSTALPSQNTMYAIAASEMGEKILKTETAGKAQQALNAWLDAQVKQISKGN